MWMIPGFTHCLYDVKLYLPFFIVVWMMCSSLIWQCVGTCDDCAALQC
jgi:hypothetical protein